MAADGAVISARDLCMECSERRHADNTRQLIAGQGPHYEEYKRGMIAFAKSLERQ